MRIRCSAWTLGLTALALSAPCAAQYKVIAADGSVTYTDRPTASAGGRVTPLRRNATVVVDPSGPAANPSYAALPIELRQVAARFPVTLYATADCPPCDAARLLLQQRGVPYVERRIVTEEDAVVLERLVGWRTLPSVSIGAQALRGYSAAEWGAYVDAAGYPRESRLPRGWSAGAATPLTERAPVPPVQAAPPAPTSPTPSPAPNADSNPPPATGIRF